MLGPLQINITQKDLAFKNNASFRSCITKNNCTFIDNEEVREYQ